MDLIESDTRVEDKRCGDLWVDEILLGFAVIFQ